MTQIPVFSYKPTDLYVIEGLRQRFAEDNKGYEDIRIAAVKAEADATQPPYEVIVNINGGQSLQNDVMREQGLTLLVFADGYGEANDLAGVVCEYLQSLVALGKIKYVSIAAAGTPVENPGTQQLRLITAAIRVRASKTTNY